MKSYSIVAFLIAAFFASIAILPATAQEQQAVGAAVPGLAGAIWADSNNDGYVDGYVYNGQYYRGAPTSPAQAPARFAQPPPAARAPTLTGEQSPTGLETRSRAGAIAGSALAHPGNPGPTAAQKSEAMDWWRRGLQLAGASSPQQALEAYRKAAELDPTNGGIANEIGLFYSKLGDWVTAAKQFTLAAQLLPNEPIYKQNLALANQQIAAGQATKAEAQQYFQRGDQLMTAGQYNDAVTAYMNGTSRDPTNAQAYNNEGIAFLRMTMYSSAEDAFSHAIRLNPNNPQFQANLRSAQLAKSAREQQRQQTAQAAARNAQADKNADFLRQTLGALAAGYEAGRAMQPSRPPPPPTYASPPRQVAVAPQSPAPNSAQVMAQRQAQITAQQQAQAQAPSAAQSQADANRLRYQQMQAQMVAEQNAKAGAAADQQRAQSAAMLAAARAGRSVAPSMSPSPGGGNAGIVLQPNREPGFARASGGCGEGRDCEAVRKQQEEIARLAPVRQREEEERRLKQQQINEQIARDRAENLRQLDAYRARLDQQQRQRQAAVQQQINDAIHSPGAMRVSNYAGPNNLPYFTAFNNTDVLLTIEISYELRGADGTSWRGQTSCTAGAHSSCDWVYPPGPVDTTKKWTVQDLNMTWHQ
jgi:Flp pilus assembly protein TadD